MFWFSSCHLLHDQSTQTKEISAAFWLQWPHSESHALWRPPDIIWSESEKLCGDRTLFVFYAFSRPPARAQGIKCIQTCRQLLILVKYFQAPPLLGSVSYSDWISSPPTSPVYPPYTTLHQATNEYSLWLSRMEKYYVYLAERIPWMSSSRFRSVYLVVSLNDAKQQSTQDILEIFADNDIPH